MFRGNIARRMYRETFSYCDVGVKRSARMFDVGFARLKEQILIRGWKKILEQYEFVSIELVREFYANVNNPFNARGRVYLRGKEIQFNTSIIAEVLGVRRVMRPEFPMNMVVTFQEVCNVLCTNLYSWSGRPSNALSLKYEYLNNILSTNLDPKKYTYQVLHDRELLMYAIGTRIN
ncbi:hypothetical protein Dsin_009285 [Dipteronia sinensis]|uniref:Putative plant transposon protein domain-containing protein n=1 Tax=Dipteronia sinensis TaxID=43782 RepID=A0AAE0AQZ9_9ROSI|nr:hypothetical protein Dsin_009285 [Dipteronia sinensis]